jgi:hypothetical protein
MTPHSVLGRYHLYEKQTGVDVLTIRTGNERRLLRV